MSLAVRLARAGWLAMLALHVWILLASWWGGRASFNSQLLLICSNLFFFGKVLDLEILRVRVTRQSVIAGLMIVTLFHVGAIDRALGLEADPLLWMQVCVSSVLVLSVSLLPAGPFSRVSTSISTLAAQRAAIRARWWNDLADEVQRRLRHFLAIPAIVSRPPPHR